MLDCLASAPKQCKEHSKGHALQPKPSRSPSRAGAAAAGYQSVSPAAGLDGEHAASPDLAYSAAAGLKMKAASPPSRCEAERVNS